MNYLFQLSYITYECSETQKQDLPKVIDLILLAHIKLAV